MLRCQCTVEPGGLRAIVDHVGQAGLGGHSGRALTSLLDNHQIVRGLATPLACLLVGARRSFWCPQCSCCLAQGSRCDVVAGLACRGWGCRSGMPCDHGRGLSEERGTCASGGATGDMINKHRVRAWAAEVPIASGVARLVAFQYHDNRSGLGLGRRAFPHLCLCGEMGAAL